MKKIIVILLLGALALPGLLPAQSGSGQSVQEPKQIQPPPLTRFDLDFSGGPPLIFVAAIQTASHTKLNTIIPVEFAKFNIPALEMRGVTVPDLFAALRGASQKFVKYRTSLDPATGLPQDSMSTIEYGFKTEGAPREDSVWYFYHVGQAAPDDEPKPKEVCRFYQLAPYLETYKVEDITTAIETGWKMLGTERLPKVSFHKDTKLLIAVGDPDLLGMIDSVLSQLTAKVPQTTTGFGKVPAPDKSREPAKP